MWDQDHSAKGMRPEMLQYIHVGHKGKEHCLLRAKNTVFWPKITYDIQQLIEKCMISQEYGKSQPLIGITQELPLFQRHTLATDLFYWKRMDFILVADVFSKYIIVRKLPNSSPTAVCIELSMIVTELGLPHVIKSGNGPCYNSKEFQQFLQWYSIQHQMSSPNHPRSNGFAKRMVGVAKKLMDKAGKEGKPWISGLFDYRVTLQSGSITSPSQLMTQRTPREKNLPQLPSALGAPNSYWIIQENGAEQPRVHRCTRTSLKIRSTSTDGEQKAQMKEWMLEKENVEFHIPAIPNGNRNFMVKNSQDRSSSNSVQPPLPTLDLPNSEVFF